jgi:serine/threonine-protein kinase PknG
MLPGEPAARLAVAVAAELNDDAAAAGPRYERVWRVDRGFASAAFGLARMRSRADRTAARTVLDEVPDTSSHYIAAQVAALRVALAGAAAAPADLAEASGRLERLALDAARHAQLSVEMYLTALEFLNVEVDGPRTTPARIPRAPVPDARLLGAALTEHEMRLGLEKAYRTLASLESDTRARYALVDRANAVRPRTMV